PYEYTDTLVYSGFTKKEAEQTNIYEVLGADADISRYIKHGGFNNKEYPNCIDPALFTDKDGKIWMTYGSWSGGIFILEIDPATGLPIFPKDDPAADPYYGYHLIGGEHHAVEGPFIIYSPESGYYHLFVSYGNLQANGGYQIRQFRSESPTGPFVDPSGKTLDDEDDFMNYGLKMMGNYTLPSLAVTYMAPGGQSAFVDKDGDYCLTYHQRFSDKGEYHEPRVHKMFLTEDGWFTASVFETNTDALSEKGYKTKDISGRFYILNHGLDVSDAVHEYEEATFANGEFKSESFNGKYEVKDGTSFITLTTDDGTYQGIIEEMTDESKNEVLTISAVGDNNETIWAVKYK
nr:glycoside hydrolase family 43 protein [Lachnospiraceae bacterium]